MHSALALSTSSTKPRIESYNAMGNVILNKLMNLLISLARDVVVYIYLLEPLLPALREPEAGTKVM